MNLDDPRYDLIRRHVDDQATPEDHAELEKQLREDADFRSAYVRYVNLDLALGSASQAAPAPTPRRRSSSRPLLAAAAGLLIGVCGSSLVWAMALPASLPEALKPLVLLLESFEDPAMNLPPGFPTKTGRWTSDDSRIVGPERSIAPKDGQRMLRMEAAEPGRLFNHAHHLLDLHDRPGFPRDRARQVRVTASFHATDSAVRDRYVLRAASFAGDPASLDPEWMKTRWNEIGEHSLAHAARGITIPPDVDAWRTFTLTVDVPPESDFLAFSLWAATMHGKADMRDVHYLDDVRVTVEPEAAP